MPIFDPSDFAAQGLGLLSPSLSGPGAPSARPAFAPAPLPPDHGTRNAILAGLAMGPLGLFATIIGNQRRRDALQQLQAKQQATGQALQESVDPTTHRIDPNLYRDAMLRLGRVPTLDDLKGFDTMDFQRDKLSTDRAVAGAPKVVPQGGVLAGKDPTTGRDIYITPPAAPYTLSDHQTRYDGSNTAVARPDQIIQQDPEHNVVRIPGISGPPAGAPRLGAPAAGDPGLASIPLADGPPPAPGAPGEVPAAFVAALRAQESGGRAGVPGPVTQYGQAHGTMQVLDPTGQGVARKLGIAWRPDLMRGKSQEAIAYQDRIGKGYAQEAWDASGGDIDTAAKYYYGGPDRRRWGPKTHQYSADIRGRMGAPAAGQAGVNAGASVGSSGAEILIPGQPKPDDVPLKSPTVDYVAQQYMLTGQLPAMGMGRAGANNRAAILNRAAEIEAETGATGADAVARHQEIKASAVSLNALMKQRSLVESFEETARKNADLMLSLAPKGAGPTNAAVLNRWIQAGRKQVAGDPDVTRFDIAIETFSKEYAKILSGATGAAGSTDTAAKDAKDLLSRYASKGQLAAGIATMKQEMNNRLISMRQQEAALQAGVRSAGPRRSPADGAPRVRTYNPKTGRLE